MAKGGEEQSAIVKFLRQKDYILVKELGQGACGRTVLLRDAIIEQRLVCKKYVPYDERQRKPLFEAFIKEIKLLHQVHHENVVRVFNYYVYPTECAGYILMEFVEGHEIDDHVKNAPEQLNELFTQAVNGFSYLEECGILHRDIRPANLMVRDDGRLKIIDLGFGKQILSSTDYNKSISLNWWCTPPQDFKDDRYDFQTEVYFVGKLFEKLIQDNNIENFKFADVLSGMCATDPSTRTASFLTVSRSLQSRQFAQVHFTDEELKTYREFAFVLAGALAEIETGAKYVLDIERVRTQLSAAHRSFMLEVNVPNPSKVINCFIDGKYSYYPAKLISTGLVLKFIQTFRSMTADKCNIVLANLHSRFDTIERPKAPTFKDEDIPF